MNFVSSKMNYLSEVSSVFRQAFRLKSAPRIAALNHYSTKETSTTKAAPIKDDDIYNEDELSKLDAAGMLVAEDLDDEEREREIEQKRNKSRLNRTHRNFLNNKARPLEDLKTTVTLYHSRKQYALYGSASGIDPRICYPTPAELQDKMEYERVKYPLTIQQMMENVKREKAEAAKKIQDREDKIVANLGKLNKWKTDLEARVTKKEAEAKVAKAKREQLLEDVRQEIGFKIDFKDPRFKALMEKKELDAKKAKKAEKKQKREELLIAKVKEEAQAVLATDAEKKEADGDETDDDEATVKAKSKDKAVNKKPATTKDGDASDSDSDDERGGKKKK